jgi:YVTN family beta-propeller protein
MSHPRSSNVWAIIISIALSCFIAASPPSAKADPPTTEPHVGPTADGTIAPDLQLIRPAGTTLAYAGRPFDLALSPDGAIAFVKNATGVTIIDAQTWTVLDQAHYVGEDGSMHGIAATPGDGGSVNVYVTGSHASFLRGTWQRGAGLEWGKPIRLPALKRAGDKGCHALGIAVTQDAKIAYVCLSINNSLAVIDLQAGAVTAEMPVGVCPYSVVLSPDESTAYVTNFGGRPPATGQPSADSAGTAVAVDRRGIPLSGTVSRVDLRQRKTIGDLDVGLHPCQVVASPDGNRLFVANANSDSISVIDVAKWKVAETIDVRPDPGLPFGSVCDALALSRDGRTLYCANGGNNAIGVIDVSPDHGLSNRVMGFIPTGWFPGAIALGSHQLFIANVKGEGSREEDKEHHAWNSRRYRGSVTRVDLPKADELARYTQRVKQGARIPEALHAMELGRSDRPPVPVPARAGEPSVFEHVVYVLKENRTYDQVFGDIGKGNSDPRLCIYGKEATPNQHALADQFALLDNYYCNGVVSADGHQWATQGMVTDYQEKDFGGWTRSYDFGTDALCYAACNFLWDTALLHGLSFRNYGEFDFPELTGSSKTWFDVDREWKQTGTIKFKQSIDLAPLKPYTAPDYPGWLLKVPDQYRIERFQKEFEQFEKTGTWPNLVIVYLPQDHTSGTGQSSPTPRALVADNDLAVGRLVEAVSHSRFWPKTCIFVEEDDPQNGFDHVDGHRSTCLVVSPHTRRGEVVSKFYNQTAVLHTICQILGLPPMNQMVASAPTMEDCFIDKPDRRPFDVVKNLIALDEPNKQKSVSSTEERRLTELAEKFDLSRPDRVDDDVFNRLLWTAARPGEAFPVELAGAHGKGLQRLNLRLQKRDSRKNDDDD